MEGGRERVREREIERERRGEELDSLIARMIR